MNDLFSNIKKTSEPSYSANDIEVLEGLEHVRLRPGMYIGGTDEAGLHHLVKEIFDNSMDEVVAGHASIIEIHLAKNNMVTVSDNGRGIPIDPHPKFPDKSALEVILTTLYSGGKFNNKIYQTSGGLHGVGMSVVNALSDFLEVTIIRDKKSWQQKYEFGKAVTNLEDKGPARGKGTAITFHPDPSIFKENPNLSPYRLYKMARSNAYLLAGVEIRWSCDKELANEKVPVKEIFKFANGLNDYLNEKLPQEKSVTKVNFCGSVSLSKLGAKVEWAIGWSDSDDLHLISYCNTIPTPQGGTHEQGFRTATLKAIRNYAEMTANKKANNITIDDILSGATLILSVFIHNPEFAGQTKEKLVNSDVAKLVENAVKDRFDHFLSANKQAAELLLEFIIARMEERLSRKADKEINRKTPVHRLRLPGKLADCSSQSPIGTELFLVEGDSAGGSAKQARDRVLQAVLPLRGKILNVANSTMDKIRANNELADLELALGCGSLKNYDSSKLRYDKVIIMTDADIDGAHISSLLMTFFYRFMPKLVEEGHLYLAKPPLYRITQGIETFYASDDAAKDKLVKKLQAKSKHIDVGRFKGLGEMTAKQLKETTMNRDVRTLIKIELGNYDVVEEIVESLMGKKPELRLKFIQEQISQISAVNLDI